MTPYLEPGVANVALGMNANSLHAPGRAAFEAMELARRSFSRCIGASRPSEIVFTSGATEACNAALIGLAHAKAAELKRRSGADAVARVIVSEIEHDAVLRPAARLEAEGFDVVRLKPDAAGFLRLADLEEALNERTVLASIQFANSEMGAIQPIAEMARAAHQAGALFHTDATQVLGKAPVNLKELGVDAASFSAHKIGGPKGVGLLYLKTRTPFDPFLLGGGQEGGKRSTTQNVCGIVGFAAACERAVTVQDTESKRQRGLRDYLYERLVSIKGVRPTVNVEQDSLAFLPNLVHVLVKGYESETLVLRLDRLGFGVSGGSACSSHSLEPSKVLRAMGISADDAYGALRVSFGSYTSKDEVERFADALESCI
jgi:cysteine desulfurase